MTEVTCPYCGFKQNLDNEVILYEDEAVFQTECKECGMVMNVAVSISIDLEADKCPCQLNHHKYRLQHVYPRAFAKWECESCGQTKELTLAQRRRLGIQTKEEYFEELRKWPKLYSNG